ncbi:MAG TPA: hypothetical protein VMV49_13780 [Candidatus Deferrimicrobium sp.]|nr:hypothetical protein [Candidatus Deferrimicrobium sp.]
MASQGLPCAGHFLFHPESDRLAFLNRRTLQLTSIRLISALEGSMLVRGETYALLKPTGVMESFEIDPNWFPFLSYFQHIKVGDETLQGKEATLKRLTSLMKWTQGKIS